MPRLFAGRSGWVLTVILVLALLTPFMQPIAYAQTVPEARLARLTRGVNLSHWFRWVEQDDLAEHAQNHLTEQDFTTLHDLGVRHVRIQVDFDLLVLSDVDMRLNPFTLSFLNEAITRMLDHDIAVIITPAARFDTFVAQPENIDAAMRFWHDLALGLRGQDPERVFFQIANEPTLSDITLWQTLQGQIIQAIREVAPEHTILTATPSSFGAVNSQYNPVEALTLMQPYADRNVVYNFHQYEPTIFTHQDTDWAYAPLRFISGLTYPSSPENADQIAAQIAPQVAGTAESWIPGWVREYGRAEWNPVHIKQIIAPAVLWQARYQVPVIVDEFGTIMTNSPVPPDSREQWLRDNRRAFERYGFGWTVWEYIGDFGFVSSVDDRRVVDPATIAALFLDTAP